MLFNCRGLQGKLTENDFRREYIELRDGFYHIVGLAEPWMDSDYSIPGLTVYHEPRRLPGFSSKRGGFSFWLRASLHLYSKDLCVTQLRDGVPPETVSLLFDDGSIFGCEKPVVLIGSYVTNDPDFSII